MPVRVSKRGMKKVRRMQFLKRRASLLMFAQCTRSNGCDSLAYARSEILGAEKIASVDNPTHFLQRHCGQAVQLSHACQGYWYPH